MTGEVGAAGRRGFLGAGAAIGLVLAMPLAGCADEGETITVSGEFGYRERIALLPGARGTVTVEDVSLADAPSRVLAKQDFDMAKVGVPAPFALKVPVRGLEPHGMYSVRAVIRDREGRLLWSTDTVNLIDPARVTQSVGLLVMVKVR